MAKDMLAYTNYKDCAEAYSWVQQTDRPLSLLIFLESQNRLVTEALDIIADSDYYVTNYKEVADCHEYMVPELVKCIVHCKRIQNEYGK